MQSKLYYPTGAVYAVFTEKKRKYFYEDGTLKTKEEIEDGKLHGSVLLYWPNGQLKRKSFFSHGKRDGSDQMWDEAGRLWDEGFYENGNGVKIHRKWGRSGRLVQETKFLGDGRCNFKEWDEEGKLIASGEWDEKGGYVERHFNFLQGAWVEKRKMG
jgi:antitoxin component YwqK of YwqJK toxin-antitoxin module